MRHNEYESLAKQLRDSGLKLTPQRLEVFREIKGRTDHPDAAAIYASVKRRLPAISLDTVYRTLWMLKESGLITTLSPSHDSIRFDANVTQHHHFVCTRCGKTEDFFHEDFNSLRIPDVAQRFGSVLHSQVELRGVCKQCSLTKAKTPSPEKRQPNR